jgi:Pentapeptide repeats (8 copies)
VSFQAHPVGKARIDESQRVVLDHVQLHGADFSGRKLVQFSAVGSRLEGCRFDKAKMEDASFGAGRETSEYVECSFDGARVRFGPGGYTRFVRCSFRNVDLRDWFLLHRRTSRLHFQRPTAQAFSNGTVPEEKRGNAARDHNEFHDNDFSAMEFIDVAFRTGIDLTEQRLPSGPDYLYLPDATAAIRRVRAEVVHWQDLDMRQPALTFLNSLGDELVDGQRQLLLRSKDYAGFTSIRDDVVEAVFAQLQSSGSPRFG